jgi:hypothetical protein
MTTEKIVIVSGQEFRVPADTDNEAIRNQLKSNFPDVANATVQKGKREIDGVEYDTIEFVKKAGTKGMDADDLVALLAQVSPAETPAPGELADSDDLLGELVCGRMTTDMALCYEEQLTAALNMILEAAVPLSNEGTKLCKRLGELRPTSAACRW